MTRQLRCALALIGCAATLAGCGDRDPYRRNDVWYPTGANAANLAAMVANPNDLTTGRSDRRQLVSVPAKAVGRVWSDTPKSLTPGGESGGYSGGGGGGAAPPPAPGGG